MIVQLTIEGAAGFPLKENVLKMFNFILRFYISLVDKKNLGAMASLFNNLENKVRFHTVRRALRQIHMHTHTHNAHVNYYETLPECLWCLLAARCHLQSLYISMRVCASVFF